MKEQEFRWGVRECLAAAALLVAGGCTSDPEPRPVTFEVITYEVLQPSCGAAHCHSTLTHTADLAFDSLAATRESLQGDGTVRIMDVIEDQSMPADSPMDARDIALLQAWIDAGEPGL